MSAKDDAENIEALRLAEEDRADLTATVQGDRRDDAPSEREKIRDDRQTDLHFTTDKIQEDRLADQAPQVALEVVRADKLESLRRLCLCLVVAIVALGFLLAFVLDGMTEITERIETSQTSTEELERGFQAFQEDDQAYLAAHERTQRLICNWYRENKIPLPDNGDCNNR